MYRRIDRITGAKAVFIKSGIPGSVGSAACALWQELAPRLTASRGFKVWPFEGDLQVLLESSPIVVGEIYPRAAYATALLDVPPASRAPLIVAKTDAGVRREAIQNRFGPELQNVLLRPIQPLPERRGVTLAGVRRRGAGCASSSYSSSSAIDGEATRPRPSKRGS